MRLTEKQLVAICETFSETFFEHDSLWLFGSRVDDAKRGGDIDLYIETNCDDWSVILKHKRLFLVNLKLRIGDQKIDVVVKSLCKGEPLAIYDVARNTGIKLV